MMKNSMNGSAGSRIDTVQAGQVCPNRLETGTEAPQSAGGEDTLQGTVINVQRFSTHDGPGVRTSVTQGDW